MIKAIIFDCFGVLLTDALQSIVDELRLTNSITADEIVQLVTATSKGAGDREFFRTAVASKLGMTRDEYADTIKNSEIRNQSLLDYIIQLRPRFKTGLLSNVGSGGLEVRFPDDELAIYFDVVVASGDTGFAKPEAQAYEITADRLGVRFEECIMIDDRQDYCQGAVGVGMQAIQYVSFEQMKSDLEKLL